ncbi:MAG: class I SAM-dependent methyltransferase [Acidobacteriota bacterium]
MISDAGFSEANCLEQLGVPAFPSGSKTHGPGADLSQRLDGGTPLETLIRLFVFGHPVPDDGLVSHPSTARTVEKLTRFGLASKRDGVITPLYSLIPVGQNIFVADRQGTAGQDVDRVMAPAPSSRALHSMAIRRAVDHTLDLGSGCGIQAVAAAASSRQVMGVDVNPRAVEFGRFNAVLNDVSNVDFAVADLFQPGNGHGYDHILCNPPFLIGPRMLFVHSSNDLPADKFCREIVSKTPEKINEGGFFQIVCNWAQSPTETSREHIEKWFDGSGCDVWVLHSHTENAHEYARSRANELAKDISASEELYDDWIHYLDKENIAAVNYGVITMRRRSKVGNWFRYDEVPGVRGMCGRSIELGFSLHDFLDSHSSDDLLLDSTLKSSPFLELIQNNNATSKKGARIARLGEGLTFSAEFDTDVADFVGKCDGTEPLRSYLSRAAAIRKTPMEYLLPGYLSVVRHLIELELLLPVEVLSMLD